MRVILPLALIAVTVAGCARADMTPPEAYKSLKDRAAVTLGLWDRFPPCTRPMKPEEGQGYLPAGGKPVIGREFIGDENCYRLAKSERMAGVWEPGFELSSFRSSRSTTGRPPTTKPG
jgi:hypothetical protein